MINWLFFSALAFWLISLAGLWLLFETEVRGHGPRWPWRRCRISPSDAQWLAEALGDHQCPLCDRAMTDHFAP